MQPTTDIPYCPIPSDVPYDVIPMVIVIGLFVLAGWLIRRWRRKRKGSSRK